MAKGLSVSFGLNSSSSEGKDCSPQSVPLLNYPVYFAEIHELL